LDAKKEDDDGAKKKKDKNDEEVEKAPIILQMPFMMCILVLTYGWITGLILSNGWYYTRLFPSVKDADCIGWKWSV
jgi:hypothetical protein